MKKSQGKFYNRLIHVRIKIYFHTEPPPYLDKQFLINENRNTSNSLVLRALLSLTYSLPKPINEDD